MHHIYRQLEAVFSWLGAADSASDQAIDALHLIAKAWDQVLKLGPGEEQDAAARETLDALISDILDGSISLRSMYLLFE